MRQELIYSMKNIHRDDFNIYGYRFGNNGVKAACIVGSLRGHEVQQLYICSLLVKLLKDIELHGGIVGDNEILVIPSVNYPAMNVGKHFWSTDNSDINRLFPGDATGETTKRLAAGVFDKVKDYGYGIQFGSLYMTGDYVPHVRMMETGYHNPGLANLFGLPYVVMRKPTPYDTATLNYNWQMNGTNAFTVYSASTEAVNEPSARQAASSVLRFLTRMGIIRYSSHSGYIASVIREEDLTNVKTDRAGFFRRETWPGAEVLRGDLMATIIEPGSGEVISRLLAPTDGIVFFAHSQPMVMERAIVFKIIRRLHA